MANDKNYISFWFWLLALFVVSIPCIGWIMIIVWAFVGENESRKNYFRALIAWFFICLAIWLALAIALGFLPFWPEVQKQIQTFLHRK